MMIQPKKVVWILGMDFAPVTLAGLLAMQTAIFVLINLVHQDVLVTMLIKIPIFALTQMILPLAAQTVERGNVI